MPRSEHTPSFSAPRAAASCPRAGGPVEPRGSCVHSAPRVLPRARAAPALPRSACVAACVAACVQRWSSTLSFAAVKAFASTLLSLPLHSAADADGCTRIVPPMRLSPAASPHAASRSWPAGVQACLARLGLFWTALDYRVWFWTWSWPGPALGPRKTVDQKNPMQKIVNSNSLASANALALYF